MPATVYTVLIDLAIKFGPDEVDAAVITESTPLRIDEDVLLLGARFVVKKLCVLNRLHVASVTASTWIDPGKGKRGLVTLAKQVSGSVLSVSMQVSHSGFKCMLDRHMRGCEWGSDLVSGMHSTY